MSSRGKGGGAGEVKWLESNVTWDDGGHQGKGKEAGVVR